MEQKDDFQARIDSIRNERMDSANATRRDIFLSRAERAWSPMVAHIQALADAHFPADKRLKVEMTVKEDLSFDLTFTVQTNVDNGSDYYKQDPDLAWRQVNSIRFHRYPGKMTNALLTGGFSLRNLFRDKSMDDFAVCSVEIGEKDPKLKSAALHPARMEQARDLMTYWLAKQMAFDFDSDRINPATKTQTIIRKNTPDHGPRQG